MEKMSLEEFRSWDDSAEVLKDTPKEVLAARYETTMYRQLMDLWGEVKHSMDIWNDKRRKKDPVRQEALNKQLQAVHRLCCIIYSNPKIADYAKDTLKIAEWELYDFTLWDNQFRNNSKSVMRWFDQWCFYINYELL